MKNRIKVLIFMINIFIQLRCRELPKEIYELCPHSDICNRTASKPFVSNGFVPCCQSCSCDENCGLRPDCCFDDLDKYKLLERGKVACIEPVPKKGKVSKYIQINSYYMVKTCGEGNTNTSRQACRLEDEFGNFLLSPVSSSETNLIYVNAECALCNNLNSTNIKQWNYLFVTDIPKADSSIGFVIDENVENKIGTIIFIPPIEEDWTHKICYTEYTNDEANYNTTKTWQALCRDLHSPIQIMGNTYKNIFCALGNDLNPERISSVCNSKDLKSMFALFRFTLLVNYALTEATKFHTLAETTGLLNTKHTCPAGYVKYMKEMCLTIYCPEGMVKTTNGCKHFALKWYPSYIMMQVKLLPKQGAIPSVSELPAVGTREQRNPFLWLKIPCRKVGLNTAEVHVSVLDDINTGKTNVTKDFVVRLFKKVDRNHGIDPSITISMFEKCVRETWIARLGNKAYRLDSYFDRYSMYIQDGKQKLEKWPSENMSIETLARPALYTLTAEGPVSLWGNYPHISEGLILKKLFYCNQVRVPYYDVEVGYGEIRILSKNISFGTNEYLSNVPLLDGNSEYRDINRTLFTVCVDDFDPSYSENEARRIFSKFEVFPSVFMLIWRFVMSVFR